MQRLDRSASRHQSSQRQSAEGGHIEPNFSSARRFFCDEPCVARYHIHAVTTFAGPVRYQGHQNFVSSSTSKVLFRTDFRSVVTISSTPDV